MKVERLQFILPFDLIYDLDRCIYIKGDKDADVSVIGEELKQKYDILATAAVTGLRLDYYYTPAE